MTTTVTRPLVWIAGFYDYVIAGVNMCGTNLETLLAPISTEVFLREYWAQRFLFIEGVSDKLAHLLTWDQFGRCFEDRVRDSPGPQIFRSGLEIPNDLWMTRISFRGRELRRLNAERVDALLSDGATMLVDCIDETRGELRDLAENLESVFRGQVHLSLVGTTEKYPYFKPTYKGHDIIALQIAGRRRWSVFGARERFPLRGAVADIERVADDEVWESELGPGSFLYIPRGCWHAASPLPGSALTLLVSIYGLTGVDLLVWLIEQATYTELVRQDLPLESDEALAKHFAELLAAVGSQWNQVQLSDFLRQVGPGSLPRTEIKIARFKELPND